jgi:hypothetical protein
MEFKIIWLRFCEVPEKERGRIRREGETAKGSRGKREYYGARFRSHFFRDFRE